MLSSELSFTYLLEKANSFPSSNRKKLFLEAFPGSSQQYQIIEEIIKANQETEHVDFTKFAASNALESLESSDYVGKKFDSWVATDIIATTSKNIILKAEPADNSYDQIVAIKIPSRLFNSVIQDNYIKKQAHLMEVLKHPNLIELKGVGNLDGIDYVVMEYLSNENVVQYCQRNNLSLEKRLSLFEDICSCISNMHCYSVIHSDLKPDNIMMNAQGIVKILDFDLSNVQDEQVNSGYQYTNMDGRTKEYASPEQLVSGKATKQSDVFALGKILFEMLTGEQFDLQKTTLNLEFIFQKYGKNSTSKESFSIIKKACKVVSSDRYDSVQLLKEDVKRVYSSSVVKAYNVNFILLYRAYKKITFNKVFSLSIATLFVTIIISIFGYFAEQNVSNNSMKALTAVVDPRKIDSINAFDTLAEKVYTQNWVFKSSQFKQLIDFGDAYYGSGKLEKAIKFFSKAKSLYPDKAAHEHIVVVSKLALAKYTSGYIHEALTELSEFRAVIFTGKELIDPALISMLFTMIEVNSQVQYLNWLGEQSHSVYETLKLVNLANITSDNERSTIKANLLFFKSIDIYYNLPNGDSASSSVLHSEAEYQKETKPALIEAKSYLLEALEILKDSSISSHREPLIYLWLGRLNSELRLFDEAVKNSERGLKLTKLFFGLEHPRVIDALLKQYAAMRNIAPKQALNSVKNAVIIANNFQKNQYSMYVYPILVDASLSLGDLDYARITFHDALKYAKQEEAKNNLSYIDLDAITAMMTSYLDFAFHYSLDVDLMPYIEDFIRYENLLHKGNVNDGMFQFTFDYLQKLSQKNESQLWSSDLYNTFELHYKRYKTGDQQDDFRYIGQIYADFCAKLEFCDPDRIIQKTKPYELWTHEEDKTSYEKLMYYLRRANTYISMGEYEQANNVVEKVRVIFDYLNLIDKNNVFISIFNEIKIKYHIHRKEYSLANQLITEALFNASLHFPKSSRIYKSLDDLKDHIDDKYENK